MHYLITVLWLFYVVPFIIVGEGFPGQNTPPVFEFKRKWLIPENEAVGTRIVTVRASDDEKDRLEFDIEPAVFLDGSQFFRINKKTGEVFLVKSLEGQVGNDYYLFITANDSHQVAKIEVYVRVLGPGGSSDELTLDVPFSTSKPPSRGSSRVRPFQHYRHNANPPYLPSLPDAPAATPSPNDPLQKFPAGRFYPPNSQTPTTSPDSIFSLSEGSTPTIRTSTSKESSSENGKSREHDELTTTVLPILAVFGFTPLVAVIFWILYKRCLKPELRKPTKEEKSKLNDLGPYASALYHSRSRKSISVEMFNSGRQRWEIPRHHLKFIGLLGEGCFGQVWKCEALVKNSRNDEAHIVAVKTLKSHATEKEKEDLLNELEIMKFLDPHPNVVTLLGSCTDREPLLIIMEYIPFGKLQTYLRETRAERICGNQNRTSKCLTSRDLTSFAYQVGKGMEYLSSKMIIHRDLAARNILVGGNKECKIADFGFARDVIASHIYERRSEGRLPIRWMAPESLFDNIFTTKTDVWSFGILMWEIVTLGSTPYPGMSAQEVMQQVRGGYRLDKPSHCKREMYNAMYYCWSKDPQERPSFTELTVILDRMLIDEHEYIELDRFPEHTYYNITNLSGEKL